MWPKLFLAYLIGAVLSTSIMGAIFISNMFVPGIIISGIVSFIFLIYWIVDDWDNT